MKRLTLVLTCFFISMSFAIAQNRQVTGTVKDEAGEPVIGATVMVKGTTTGTVTDPDGRFSLSVPGSAQTLVIKFMGMADAEVAATGRVSVVMRASSRDLDELVVTALGLSREKKTIGYAVASFDGAEIAKTAVSNPMQALAGKVAGVDIQTSSSLGGTANVNIRGFNTFGNNQPLYIVDGVPLTNNQSQSGSLTETNTLNSQADFGSGINAINPNDIENISVLRGSAASALYGSRAAQGVIMITTKSGKNSYGKLTVDYSGGLNISQVGRLPLEQSMFGQGWGGNTALDENGNWGPVYDGKDRVWGYVVNNSQQLKPYVYLKNRVRDFFDPGVGHNHALSFSGSNDNATFRASLSYDGLNGPIPTDDDSYKRYTLSSNASWKARKLTVSTAINFSYETNQASPTGQDNSIFRSINEISTGISIIDLKDMNNIFNMPINYFTPYGLNPYYVLDIKEAMQRKSKFFGKLQFDYDILSNLKATYRFGGDFESSIIDMHYDAIDFPDDSPHHQLGQNEDPGSYSQSRYQSIQTNHDAFLTYSPKFGDFSLNAIAGLNVNERSTDNIRGTISSIFVPGLYHFSNTEVPAEAFQRSSLYRLWGVYLNADLGFRDYLYLTGTLRNDNSSTLPVDNRSYVYGGGMLSFLVTDFLKENDIQTGVLNFAKLRLAYGSTGKDAAPYMIYDRFTAAEFYNPRFPNIDNTSFPLGGKGSYSLNNRAGNQNLKPELTYEFEIGAELYFFKNRAGIDFTYYNKYTNDLIEVMDLDPASGYTEQANNLGDVRNHGIELTLNLIPVKAKDFEWNVNYNFTKNNNKVERLISPEVFLQGYGGMGIYAVEGKPMGQFKTQNNLTTTIDGKECIVVDGDGMPLPAPSEMYLDKDVNEKFRMGFTNTFTWKGISLEAALDLHYGGHIYSYTADYMGWVGNGAYTVQNDRRPFIIPNSVVQNADGSYSENTVPIKQDQAAGLHTYYGDKQFGDAFIIDRSYLKLREVALGYQLPADICRKIKLNSVSFRLAASGMLLWTAAENVYIDPEVTTFGSSIAGKFGEFGANPLNRVYTLGVKVSF